MQFVTYVYVLDNAEFSNYSQSDDIMADFVGDSDFVDAILEDTAKSGRGFKVIYYNSDRSSSLTWSLSNAELSESIED